MSQAEALAYVRGLATSHYENFSVLSSLVPADLRDDFAAVYAFCRWADDLGDETGKDDAAKARSLELLAWWRRELETCFAHASDAAAAPRHPVFITLAATAKKRRLAAQPFHDLISAFEQDQRLTRYETWDQLLDYCARSANPVGRIVLALGASLQKPSLRPSEVADAAPVIPEDHLRMCDATCTALQLTNFWQDVRRDLLERDRVYLPGAETGLDAETLRLWLDTPDDAAARVRYIKAVRPLVERTRALFEQGRPLPGILDRRIRPVVWLFGAGGESVLRSVERLGCATLWRRPTLTNGRKATLLARAWAVARLGV